LPHAPLCQIPRVLWQTSYFQEPPPCPISYCSPVQPCLENLQPFGLSDLVTLRFALWCVTLCPTRTSRPRAVSESVSVSALSAAQKARITRVQKKLAQQARGSNPCQAKPLPRLPQKPAKSSWHIPPIPTTRSCFMPLPLTSFPRPDTAIHTCSP